MTVFSNFFKIAKKYLGNFIMYTCIFLGITITMTKTQQKDPVESFSETECKVAIFNHSDIVIYIFLCNNSLLVVAKNTIGQN